MQRLFMGTIRISGELADQYRSKRRSPPGIPVIARGGKYDRSRCAEFGNLLFKSEAVMSMQRIFGIVLLVGGVVLLIVGMNASHSAADQISNTFTGKFTRDTAWYIFGGGAAALVGLLMVVFGVRAKGA
jgi:hypothetical protein